MVRPVAVLYAKKRSVYHKLDVDVWDEVRDARLWPGGGAVIAHPPCRGWGRYSHWSKHTEEERQLAFHALSKVREWGGVLEHPRASKFWKAAQLPKPSDRPDRYGGYTLEINQVDWGHRAIKPTWLYIVGVPSWRLPPRPARGLPTMLVEHMGRPEREGTPFAMAEWLVDLASNSVGPILMGG